MSRTFFLSRRSRRLLVVGVGICVLLGMTWHGLSGREFDRFRAALLEDRLDEARKHFIRLDRWGLAHELFLIQAARLARLEGDYPSAEARLNRAIRATGTASREVQKEFLLLRCDRGEIDEVAPGLEQLLREGDPDSFWVYQSICRAWMHDMRLTQARKALVAWLALGEDNPQAHCWLGWVNEKLLQDSAAVESYLASLALRPDYRPARTRLVDLLISNRSAAEAMPHLEYLAASGPESAEVLGALAQARLMLADAPGAEAFARRALEIDPDESSARMCLGTLRLQSVPARFEEAEGCFRRVRDRMPWNAEAQYSLSLTLRNQSGREAEAAREQTRYREIKRVNERLSDIFQTEMPERPSDPAVYAEIGELYLKIGQKQPGVSSLRTALRFAPNFQPAHRALADHFASEGDTAQADEHRRFLPAKAP